MTPERRTALQAVIDGKRPKCVCIDSPWIRGKMLPFVSAIAEHLGVPVLQRVPPREGEQDYDKDRLLIHWDWPEAGILSISGVGRQELTQREGEANRVRSLVDSRLEGCCLDGVELAKSMLEKESPA